MYRNSKLRSNRKGSDGKTTKMKHEIRDKPVSTKMRMSNSRSDEESKKTQQKITDPTKQKNYTYSFILIQRRRTKRKPGCRARGSKVPSRHCRPEYQPDQCGLRCTPSFSQESDGKSIRNVQKQRKKSQAFTVERRRLSRRPLLKTLSDGSERASWVIYIQQARKSQRY